MTDTAASYYEPRLSRLDADVRTLSTEMGGVKAQLHTLNTGQDAIFAKLELLGSKMEANRPGIGAIWAPLSVMTAILLGVGGIVGRPYIDRIMENKAAIAQQQASGDERDEQITRLRVRQAVLEDRTGHPISAVE